MAYYDFNLGKWVNDDQPQPKVSVAPSAPLPSLKVAAPKPQPKLTVTNKPTSTASNLQGSLITPQQTASPQQTATPKTLQPAAFGNSTSVQPAATTKQLDLNALSALSGGVVGVNNTVPPTPKGFYDDETTKNLLNFYTQRYGADTANQLVNSGNQQAARVIQTPSGAGSLGYDAQSSINRDLATIGNSAKEIAQGMIYNAFSVTQSLLEPLTGQSQVTPSDKISKALLGTDQPIKSLNTRLTEAQNRVLEADKKYGFLNPNASKAEKDFSSLLLAGLGVGFMATADFTPFGGEKNVVKLIAASKDAAAIERILLKVGVATDLARPAAQKLSTISKASEVSKALSHLDDVQKTTKVAAGYSPKIYELEAQFNRIQQAKISATNKTTIKQYEKAQQAIADQMWKERQAGFINLGAKAEAPKSISFLKNKLSPIKATDEVTKETFTKWTNSITAGAELANKEASNLAGVVDDGVETLLTYEKGGAIRGGDQVSATFKNLREEGISRGLSIPERANYIPQVYKNTREEVADAMSKYLADKGVDAKTIEDYLAGVAELPESTASRLKMEPSFAKQRVFPDYDTAMRYGLTPKYTNLSQLAGHYRLQLEEAVANRNFVEELVNKGKLKSKNTAPIDWVEVPSLGRGNYADPNLANVLNNMANSNPIWKATAGLSRFLQELRLSAGLPFSTLNFFAGGQTIKHLTAGDISAVGALVRANFPKWSIKWFKNKTEIIQKMADVGLDDSMRIGNFKDTFKNTMDSKTWKEALGDGWHKAFGAKTFDSFMPQLHVQTFESAYKRALKQGLDEQAAKELAGDVTRNMFGLFKNAGRSGTTDDVLSTFFFAPKFRSSMINMLYNTGRAGVDVVTSAGGLIKPLDPALYKNRRLLMGMAISFAGYNALNYKLNGHAMWDNESGREFALKVPTKDGGAMYIEFMPSILSFVRSLASGTIALGKGDFDTAKQKYGGIASMPINIFSQIWANKNYFGGQIYNEDDTGKEKARKIAVHLGLQVNHPYVQAVVDQIDPVYETLVGEERKGRKKTLMQSIVESAELPLKFSSKEQLDDKARFKIMEENEKQLNEAKRRMQPTYDYIQKIYDEGQIDEADRLVNEMSDADYEIYKNILAADKRFQTSQGKKDMFPVVQEVAAYIENGDEAAADDVVNRLTDEEYRLYQLERDNIYPDGLPEPDEDYQVQGSKTELPPLEKVSLNDNFVDTINNPSSPTSNPQASTSMNLKALNKAKPDGTYGDQCGTFAKTLVDLPTPNGRVGNTWGEKMQFVQNYGLKADKWRSEGANVGDVLYINTGPNSEGQNWGHVTTIIKLYPDGTADVKESNWNEDEKIGTRRINLNNRSIYGAIRGIIKTQYQGQPALATSTMTPRESFNKDSFITALSNL